MLIQFIFTYLYINFILIKFLLWLHVNTLFVHLYCMIFTNPRASYPFREWGCCHNDWENSDLLWTFWIVIILYYHDIILGVWSLLSPNFFCFATQRNINSKFSYYTTIAILSLTFGRNNYRKINTFIWEQKYVFRIRNGAIKLLCSIQINDL